MYLPSVATAIEDFAPSNSLTNSGIAASVVTGRLATSAGIDISETVGASQRSEMSRLRVTVASR